MLNRASSVWSHVRVLEVDSEGTATADVVVLDDRERIVAELRGLRVRANEPRRNQAVAAEVPAASGTVISLKGEFRLEELIREIGHDRVHFHHTDVRDRASVDAPPTSAWGGWTCWCATRA